jgi:hypothetical protein
MVQPTTPLMNAPIIRPKLLPLRDQDQQNIKKTQSATPTTMRIEAETVSRISMNETIKMYKMGTIFAACGPNRQCACTEVEKHQQQKSNNQLPKE